MFLIAKLKTLWFTCLSISLAVSLIIYPKDALTASLRGLDLWWEVVFPSLLPFFIAAELLIGFGVVHGLGVLSEKLMRPLFNVPGSGGFVWVMGMASGYPAGAKWTADLRKNGQVTKVEAERLVAFTNASSPLFIFGAVAVGFFGQASLGILLAFCHYTGNFLVGIAMGFYKKKDRTEERTNGHSSWKQALQTIHHSRIEDGRSLGKLMGDAVTKSVDTLLMVGGFIMLFSVLAELLKQSGMVHLFSHLLTITGLPDGFHVPFLAGMMEVTTGIGAVTATHESLLAQLMLVSFLLGFHGFSIQAQIASILAETDIDFKPYALARIAHGSIATVLIAILFPIVERTGTLKDGALPIWSPREHMTDPVMSFLTEFGPPLTMMMILFTITIKWYRGRPFTQNKTNHYKRPS